MTSQVSEASLKQGQEFLDDQGKRRVAVVTSWDDGHTTDLRIADKLKDHGLRGTFFLTLHQLGKQDGRVPVMSRDEVAALAAREHCEIGGHTWSHEKLPCVASCPPELRRELLKSKQCLEDIVGAAVTTFAYPNGATGEGSPEWPMIKAALLEAGYASARTIKLEGVIYTDDIRRQPLLLPVTADVGETAADCLAERLDAQMRDVEEGGSPIVHVYGHSALLKSCTEKGARTLGAIEAVGSFIDGIGRERVWCCTQGELCEVLLGGSRGV